jgi:hypothetical protein
MEHLADGVFHMVAFIFGRIEKPPSQVYCRANHHWRITTLWGVKSPRYFFGICFRLGYFPHGVSPRTSTQKKTAQVFLQDTFVEPFLRNHCFFHALGDVFGASGDTTRYAFGDQEC